MLEDDTVKQEHSYGAVVERGEIVSVSSDAYTVRSLDRSGIIPLPTTTISLETYSVGDVVYFFAFGDGTGRILSKVEQSSKIVPDGSITSEKLDAGFITGLEENASGDDTDLLVVGYRGASALKKFTLANLVAFAKTKIASLLRDGSIGSVSVDFNDIADGWHQIDASTAVSNAPVTGRQTGIILQTSNMAGNGSKYQLYASSNAAECWQRSYWYGSWSAWKMIGGKQSMSITVGNGNVMTLASNASTMDGNYMYVNCSIRFTGNRDTGALLARLPKTVSATQYLTICKSAVSNVFYTNIAGGTGDIGCPTSFASGDIAYITGVISY